MIWRLVLAVTGLLIPGVKEVVMPLIGAEIMGVGVNMKLLNQRIVGSILRARVIVMVILGVVGIRTLIPSHTVKSIGVIVVGII